MKIPENYHSAFQEEPKGLGELDYFSSDKGTVLWHDIHNGIREEFRACDCVYVEPAWQKGYQTFQDRAGVKSPSFAEYLGAIQRAIVELGKPAFVVGGKHMLRRWTPDDTAPIRMNGFDALLMAWNEQAPVGVKNVLQLQTVLTSKYDKVLDFCCGYGKHLTQFKSFVGADFNKKCVYYIAHNYLGYK